MKARMLARRYATAFIHKAEQKNFESLLSDQVVFKKIINSNDQVMTSLKSRFTSSQVKDDVLKTITDDLENNELWYGLCRVILHNKREAFIMPILLEIEKMLLVELDIVKMTIHLAREHQQDTIDKIISRFEGLLDKKIITEIEIDSELIGGFVCHIGNTRIDGSIKHSLERFKKSTAGEVIHATGFNEKIH